uniref:Uncharacterized protein n=1 Tax=Alexandrium monilatum TaxID=311494 RepID=A0A7S4W6Q0_9DINO
MAAVIPATAVGPVALDLYSQTAQLSFAGQGKASRTARPPCGRSPGESGGIGRSAAAAAASVAALMRTGERRGARGAGRIAARASAAEIAKAVEEGRMITLEEQGVRKAAGIFFGALFLWQAWLLCSTGATTILLAGSPYVVLAVLASNAVGFYGSGLLSL